MPIITKNFTTDILKDPVKTTANWSTSENVGKMDVRDSAHFLDLSVDAPNSTAYIDPIGHFVRLGTSGSDILSINQPTYSALSSVGYTSFSKKGQTFTAVNSNISSVSLYTILVGIPTDGINVKIYTLSGGLPSVLIGTSYLPVASISNGGYTTFTFTDPISVSASIHYAIVVERTGSLSSTNYYRIRSAGNVYSGGNYLDYNSSWVADTNQDLVFMVYYKEYDQTKNIYQTVNITDGLVNYDAIIQQDSATTPSGTSYDRYVSFDGGLSWENSVGYYKSLSSNINGDVRLKYILHGTATSTPKIDRTVITYLYQKDKNIIQTVKINNNDITNKVSLVSIDPDHFLTYEFYITGDGGLHWEQMTSISEHTLSYNTNDLRVKIVLNPNYDEDEEYPLIISFSISYFEKYTSKNTPIIIDAKSGKATVNIPKTQNKAQLFKVIPS
jgi:hypothetical protein